MPPTVSEHLNRQIPPEAHTPMYVWHKYWSRKTWNVVGSFVDTYSSPGDLVLDPFAGSGVVAIECARRGRRAIAVDRNPIASMITDLTLRPVNLLALRAAFDRIALDCKESIENLYGIHCVRCSGRLIGDAFVREGDALKEVRYQSCPHCGYRCIGELPLPQDLETLEELEAQPILFWYPTTKFEYPDGTPFKKRERYSSVDELFTKRNLLALAIIFAAIERESSSNLRRFLLGAFTSSLHLSTRMMPVGNPAPTNHYTFFSSPGWTQHSYWSAPRFMEQNVWDKFEGSVTGPQGLLRAKEESQRTLPPFRLTNDWRRVVRGQSDIAVVTGDCLTIMQEMGEDVVDYIFTDPPYADSIQYGELSLMWNAWLRKDRSYAEDLLTTEVIHNDRQRKSFEVYHSLLSRSFQLSYAALKPSAYMSVTFHNPTFKVRNATVRAAVFAGFEYQKIHHQPLAQSSAQSMLQPFGSAQGDFYLRFHKPESGANIGDFEEVTEERFRRVVIDTTKEVIAERAEPTPYTILVNYIDPVLARQGLFGTLNTGLDVKGVLEEAVGTEFILTDAQIGSARGKLWWFNDPIFVARLRETPLSERVERTVERTLSSRGRVTFTEVWDAVSREFPNSLTQDSTSIKEALERYARPVNPPFWLMKDEVVDRIRAHSEIIAVLAMIGSAKGYDIWIGAPEQSAVANGLGGGVLLRNLVTITRPAVINGVQNLRDVLLMDILWISGRDVVCAFEVESTTTMTSGLQRGSNLPATSRKIMVLPEERVSDFQRKMQSPLFESAFTSHNWALVYFDTLRELYLRQRGASDIFAILNVLTPPQTRRVLPAEGKQRRIDFIPSE